MSTPGNDEQRRDENARLWEHLLHEDDMLFQRGNLFLIAQSLLAVAYSTIATGGGERGPARVMAAFGIVLTLVWLFVGDRHLKFYRAIYQRTLARLPDVAATEHACRRRGPMTLPFIVYGLPALSAVMWFVLLIIT